MGLLGAYELPIAEKCCFHFLIRTTTKTPFMVICHTSRSNALALGNWPGIKKLIIMICFFGTALRYQYYDDNTTATVKRILIDSESLCTDEITLTEKHKVLLGARLDYNNNHGAIFTPRLAYKWKINDNNIVRFNTGTGFRCKPFHRGTCSSDRFSRSHCPRRVKTRTFLQCKFELFEDVY
jgi:outer membrane receptor for ferrienterochelin and colicins